MLPLLLAYTEADTRAKLIDPQIKSSYWLESHIVREYYFTDGRKLIGGKRGKQYCVDYLLGYENSNLAIIEAKAENRDLLEGTKILSLFSNCTDTVCTIDLDAL